MIANAQIPGIGCMLCLLWLEVITSFQITHSHRAQYTAICALVRTLRKDKLGEIVRSCSHVSLEEDAALGADCDGDQCGTWRCLLDIAQCDWEAHSSDFDFIIYPNPFSFTDDNMLDTSGSNSEPQRVLGVGSHELEADEPWTPLRGTRVAIYHRL